MDRVSTNPAFLDNYSVDMKLIPILIGMGMRGIALRQAPLEDWDTRLSEEALFYKDICER